MRKWPPELRLGVVLLFMIGLLSPFAATGVGAQDLTCDDFNSQRAAQAVLEADPSLEDALDPDGDGEACNEDEPVDDPADDPTEEPTDDPVDDPTEEPTDDPADEPSGDAEAYLADIQDEVDSVVESFDRYVEINTTFSDASSAEQQDLIVELEDLAASWAEYPDVAAEFEAPAGLEDVEDAYLDFADLVGEAGDTWLVWWDIPSDDPEEDAALDDFTEAFDVAYAAAGDVTAAIEDAGGSTSPTDDPTEEPTDEPSADGDAYVEDVQAELDELSDQLDRFEELRADGASDDLTDAELSEVADEINDIAAGWVEYPNVAFELVAPEGYEDIEDAYLELADMVGEAGVLWEEYWAIDADLDDEELIALEAFDQAFADAQDGIGEVQDLLDDAGGSTTPSDDPTEEPSDDPTEEATEEPSDDPTEEPAGDADEYLATVSETAADWQDSIDRFSEIIGLGADATDAEFTELTEILVAWAEAPDVAAELDAPVGFEDVQAAYEDFADELALASVAIDAYLGADEDSPEADAAFDDFITAIGNAEDLSTELDDLLADAEA